MEVVMNASPQRLTACLVVAVIAVFGLLLAACGGGSPPAADQPEAARRQTSGTPPAADKAVQKVKACSLFTKAEIEAATGRTVLDPVEEELADLSTCSFGDPAAPKVAGRSLSKVFSLAVVSGGNSYFEGPVAQVRGIYEMAEKNAGGVDPVSGLGDKAHWAGLTLRVLRGPYMVEVEVDAGDNSRKIAEQLARTAVGRLP
jgi:hypothetical protein